MIAQERSMREVATINEDMGYWLAFEHDSWKLISFSERHSARFGWMEKNNLQYTKYTAVKRDMIEFMRGVQPDVFDYYAS